MQKWNIMCKTTKLNQQIKLNLPLLTDEQYKEMKREEQYLVEEIEYKDYMLSRI